MSKNAYEVLGISPTATDEEIKKQYHSLIRGVHTDKTSLEEMSNDDRLKCEEQVRAYNDAYDKLKKGRRATYDEALGLNRVVNEPLIYREYTNFSTKPDNYFSEKYEDKFRRKKQNLGPEFDTMIDQLLNDLFHSGFGYDFKGFAFQGSYTIDPSQKLKQELWKLESDKKKLEQDLKEAERKATIEFYKNHPNIEYQIDTEGNVIARELGRIELQKNTHLSGIQQEYLYKVSGRFATMRKKEKAKQVLDQEQEKIMREYNGAKKELEKKQRKLQAQKDAYIKAKEDFIKGDPKVQNIQKKLLEIGLRMDTINEQLEKQKEKTTGNKVVM